VGAGLARDSGGSANEDVGCAGVIASRLAPTFVWVSLMNYMCADVVSTFRRYLADRLTEGHRGHREV
jgi:hypothetical protein